MPAKKAINGQNKSDFIRAQPASMSAADVVKKAKVSGLKIRAGLVYEVRRVARAKRSAARKPAAASSSSAVTSTNMPHQNKAAFVRTRSHLSPKEIVEDAKADGFKITDTYVYNVRGYDKAKARKKAVKLAARRSTERTALVVARPINGAAKVEELLRAIAAEVGLGRAIELLGAERARVHAMMRG